MEVDLDLSSGPHEVDVFGSSLASYDYGRKSVAPLSSESEIGVLSDPREEGKSGGEVAVVAETKGNRNFEEKAAPVYEASKEREPAKNLTR